MQRRLLCLGRSHFTLKIDTIDTSLNLRKWREKKLEMRFLHKIFKIIAIEKIPQQLPHFKFPASNIISHKIIYN